MVKSSSQSTIQSFLQRESSSGIILIFSAVLAMVCANTSLYEYYQLLLSTLFEIKLGDAGISKPVLLWINDGFMAVFFFLVGLELKREVYEGELSSIKQVILPAVGALGGMAMPSLIYFYLNQDDPVALNGWAIPAATDIAFALGILALLGSRVPLSIKVFLTTVAIFDDLGAIVIIALFFTSKISMIALVIVVACIVLLFFLNRYNVVSKSLYIMVGIVMWVAMLKSGVHATLAGVILAFFIPMSVPQREGYSPAKSLEHDIHTTVTFFILPVFAFANAGVNLSGMSVADLLHPVPLGISLGLVLGKLVGVFGFCMIAVKLGLASLPKGMSAINLLGVAALCGIGFTMSLFIGSLAFEATAGDMMVDERIGILTGSIIAGIVGYLILNFSLKKNSD